MFLRSLLRLVVRAGLVPVCAGAGLSGAALAGLAAAGGVQVGDAVAFRFREPILNGPGITSLEDLAEKPLLIEYWGTRCPGCVNGAVPAALKLQQTYGDDLQVLFVELQNCGPERAGAFALERRWLGGRALWTSELPVDAGVSTLPACVLVGNDGRVLLKGNPFTLHKELERLVQESIKQRRTPPATVPAVLHPAWLEFHNGRFGRGLDLARTLSTSPDLDPAAQRAALQALERLRAQIDRRLARVEWLTSNGYFEEADELCEPLHVGLADVEEPGKRADELWKRLQAPELRPAREAGRVLARLQDRLFESGGDPAVAAEIEAFLAKNESTCLAGRARALLGYVAAAPCKSR